MKEGKNEMEKKKKAKKGYFSNEEMLNLLIERNQLKEIEELTQEQELRLKRVKNQIGILFFKISERLMHRPNFCNYDSNTKAEMISDAVFNCLKASERYDVKFPNPFGYFTQISWNAFILNIKAMKKRTGVVVIVNHLENLDGLEETVGE